VIRYGPRDDIRVVYRAGHREGMADYYPPEPGTVVAWLTVADYAVGSEHSRVVAVVKLDGGGFVQAELIEIEDDAS